MCYEAYIYKPLHACSTALYGNHFNTGQFSETVLAKSSRAFHGHKHH